MGEITKSVLNRLSIEELHNFAKDTRYRIESHCASDEPIPEYIKRQQGLLQDIQDEIIRREQDD